MNFDIEAPFSRGPSALGINVHDVKFEAQHID